MRSPGGPAGDDDGVTWAEACGWQAARATPIRSTSRLTNMQRSRRSRDYEQESSRRAAGATPLSPYVGIVSTSFFSATFHWRRRDDRGASRYGGASAGLGASAAIETGRRQGGLGRK